jgi:hypothetical protein
MWYLYVILVLLLLSKSQIRIAVSVDKHFVSFLFVYIIHICISIYIYIFFELILVQEQSRSHYYSVCSASMDWSGALRGDSARRLLSTRSDLDACDVYERVLTAVMISMDGPMSEPVFQRGLFMVISDGGLLINSEWSAVDGGPRGYLQFGEIFAVVHVSGRYDGHYVSPHYEAGMVRARVERRDSVWGYISVYDTRRMQHFVASMDGEPTWFRPRHLLRRLIADLREPRLPLAACPVLGVPPIEIDVDSIDDTSSEHPQDIENFHDFVYAQIDGDFQMTVQYPGDSGP